MSECHSNTLLLTFFISEEGLVYITLHITDADYHVLSEKLRNS